MPGGSQQSGNQVVRNEPPAYQLPYLQEGLSYAGGLFGEGGPEQYGGSTVVPFAPQSEEALAGITDRARAGSPVVDAAQGYVERGLNATPSTMFGDASNPYATSANPFGGSTNPFLDATFDQAAQKSRSVLDSEFARAGRNIGASAPARADMLTDLATQIYGGAYEGERNRQAGYAGQQLGIGGSGYESERNRMLSDLTSQRGTQAGLLGYASPLAAQDYTDLAALRGVGGEVENLTGNIQQDAASRYQYDQTRPEAALDAYLGRVRGTDYGSTTTSPLYRNRTAGALGGALSGAQLGSSFGPWGALIGAAGGGLFGAYA